MIETCFITPTYHILDIAACSKMHLLLPHVMRSDPGYFAHYKKLRKRGDYLIMDNSLFELGFSLPPEELIAAAAAVGAQEIVAPEVYKDYKETRTLASAFAKETKKKYGTIYNIGGVVQGVFFDDFVRSFRSFLQDPYIDVIYVPMLDPEDSIYKNVDSKTLRVMLNRIYFMDHVANFLNPTKSVHLLGLVDGVELQVQKRHSFIRSNDSSSAFIHGYFYIKYNQRGLPSEKIDLKMDFAWQIQNDYQKHCIIHNKEMIKHFAGYYDN